MGKLADGGCLADAIDADNHYDVWSFVCRRHEIVACAGVVVLGEKFAYFLAQKLVELVDTDILVACHTCLKTVENLKRCLGAYVRGDENLLKFIKKIIVDRAASGECAAQLAENAFLGLLKTTVEILLFLAAEEVKKAHIEIVYFTLNYCKITHYFSYFQSLTLLWGKFDYYI